MTTRLTSRTSDPDSAPPKVDQRNLLLVEGGDEQALMADLVKDMGLTGFQVHDMGGKDTKWGFTLAAMAEDAIFQDVVRSVGLVMDADQNPGGAFDKCRSALKSGGFPQPQSVGQVLGENGRRAGVFIMPGNGERGAIEDLLISTVDVSRRELAEEYLQSIKRANLTGPRIWMKGLLQACVAGTHNSSKSLRVALQKKELFDLKRLELNPLRTFIRELAG